MFCFKSYGTLRYSHSWLVVDCCNELARYYRRFIKRKDLTAPPFGAHITVVAGSYEAIVNKEFWGRYDGSQIEFAYNPYTYYQDGWYWLEISCAKLSAIRIELGLEPNLKWPFHLTIGKHDEEI